MNASQRLDASSVSGDAVARARQLIDTAAPNSRGERATRRSFRRLFQDQNAVDVIIALTDEVMRFQTAGGASKALRAAVKNTSRRGFGIFNLTGLRAVAILSKVAPTLAIRIVSARVRALTGSLILDAAPAALGPHIRRHEREGLRLNVNVLGEAVLGEQEATHRLERVLDMMRRADVNYVSVKLSSIESQLLTIDHVGSVARVATKLRRLYSEAKVTGTFVNLDMEEYRDLRLTLDAFVQVLNEPELRNVDAGIVLQAYLPDSHGALDELIDFARSRHQAGGGQVKVRLVKGANLAMEHVEAEMHGWTAAPYDTKADVDASYCRLLDVALNPEHASFLRVGVASHNLFDVSWALELAKLRHVVDQLDVEMLEGMANPEARALVASGQAVLLYAPVTRQDDFASAVAYLVRRLDENTAPENYLRAALFIAQDPKVFAEQERRFLDSLDARHTIDAARRRRARAITSARFENQPDGDPTNAAYALEVSRALDSIVQLDNVEIDSLEHLHHERTRELKDGVDPSGHGHVWYRYHVASEDEIDEALEVASAGFAAWHRLPIAERQAILRRAADVMQGRRARTIAVMARDAGKTVAEADPEVSEAIDFARFYASHAPGDDDSTPLGVVLVVPPWNFPYAIPAGGVLASLAAGNAVILKPARDAVAVSFELVSQLWDAGVPRDVLQMVLTRDYVGGKHLITHVGIGAVILTGSFETAQLFTSWKPTLRLLAETSGKNAIVVSASADVDQAVKDVVQSAFGHAGQKCSAASLAIVERAMYDDPRFLAQLEDAVTSLRVGPSYHLGTHVGPIIHPPEGDLLRAFTQLDAGESWLVEPQRLDEESCLWRPGVKLGVAPGSWSHLHEWFGPVLGVMVARDLDEATSWQNQTPYGLTAGFHSLNQDECQRWIERVEAGNLYVNRGTTGAVVHRQPFGGWKRSSVGPTAKAGGANYVNCLRHWRALNNVDAALRAASSWWKETGARALDDAGLTAEANFVRYRSCLKTIVVRVDDSFTLDHVRYLRGLVDLAGLDVEFSADTLKGVLDVTLESVDELCARAASFEKVRWLCRDEAPTPAFLARGVSVDTRPLAQNGAVELTRWLLEQSVAITNHRYGNVHAGPKPHCLGLGDWTLR